LIEKSIFKKYVIYLLIAFFITATTTISSIYFYQQERLEKHFISYHLSNSELLGSIIKGLETNPDEFIKKIDENLQNQDSIEYLNISKNGNTLYSLDKENIPHKNIAPQNDGDFELLRHNDEYYLWFAFSNVTQGGVSIVGAEAVDKNFSKEIDASFKEAIFISTLSIFITALVVFPLIFLAYRELISRKERLLRSYISTLEALGNAIAKRDSDTNLHNFRVTWYSVKLAEHIKLPKNNMKSLIMGSFLHDVGKIGIRDNILLKPGKLDEDEFTIMKTHVNHGLDIVKNIEWLDDAKRVVGEHHERGDGTGYPLGLKGEQISIEARIFAIIDVFDALSSARPYKEAFGLHRTLQIMEEESGTHFDSELFEKFKEIAEELYIKAHDASPEELHHMLEEKIEQYFEVESKVSFS
jgi:HD-GYP domain-containing protein (c-di-GMP phosphodiesterase class II)